MDTSIYRASCRTSLCMSGLKRVFTMWDISSIDVGPYGLDFALQQSSPFRTFVGLLGSFSTCSDPKGLYSCLAC